MWKCVCVCVRVRESERERERECAHIIGVLADFTTLLKHCHFKALSQQVWMNEWTCRHKNENSFCIGTEIFSSLELNLFLTFSLKTRLNLWLLIITMQLLPSFLWSPLCLNYIQTLKRSGLAVQASQHTLMLVITKRMLQLFMHCICVCEVPHIQCRIHKDSHFWGVHWSQSNGSNHQWCQMILTGRQMCRDI